MSNQIAVEVVRLAVEIADEHSISTLECSCTSVRDKIGRLLWYDLASVDDWAEWHVYRAVKYLKIRRRLRFSKKNPNHAKPCEVRP